MPVLRESKTKKVLAKDDPLTVAWLNDMYAALGMLTPEQMRARIGELVALNRKHTPDERREFKGLVKRWHRDKARQAKHARQGEKARAAWAAFTPDERAEWDARSREEHRRYDSGFTKPVLTGEDYHHLYVTMLEPDERREAKERKRRKAKREAKRAARAARLAEAATEHEAVAPEAPQPAPAAARSLEHAPEVATPPRRRRRIKYGIVRQYDAFGRLVDDDEDDD